MINVWEVPLLGVLAVAGAVLAMLGALPPARSAARLPIAEVLHDERTLRWTGAGRHPSTADRRCRVSR
ncbi:hypothetical protein [Plantactinospora sp. BC1]|uniref:hypothetical protein n=1 Tax=Plantactinospora sp. BC1 TaxID=2108470 RepID=UPI0018FE7B7C|nr:hypothetical protein [Plantactinospora sp. BC1]